MHGFSLLLKVLVVQSAWIQGGDIVDESGSGCIKE